MKCSICQGLLDDNEERIKCSECRNEFHAECWRQNGGCGTPGCRNLPEVKTKNEQHYSQDSFWGKESKICPACGEKIAVNALQCPFCDEEFSTDMPIGQEEYKAEKVVRRPGSMPPAGKTSVAVLVFGIIGFTSVFDLIFGGIWFLRNRNKLKEEYPTGYFLALAGLICSIVYTCFLILVLLFQ